MCVKGVEIVWAVIIVVTTVGSSGGRCVTISTATPHTIILVQVYTYFVPVQAASSLVFDPDQFVVVGVCLTVVVFVADYLRVECFI